MNPVSSTFKIDPEPYHFLPSFDYHPSPNTHALSLDYYFSLLLGLQSFYFCPCHSTIYSLPYSEKLLLKYQVRSFYQPQILQWLPFSLRVLTLACKALHDPIAGHLSFHYYSPCTLLQTHWPLCCSLNSKSMPPLKSLLLVWNANLPANCMASPSLLPGLFLDVTLLENLSLAHSPSLSVPFLGCVFFS